MARKEARVDFFWSIFAFIIIGWCLILFIKDIAEKEERAQFTKDIYALTPEQFKKKYSKYY
jgi:hypothetical protein